jgi:hypothetical protein
VLFTLAIGVSAGFFGSHWGIDAASLGRYDAGLALALAFAMTLAIYTSLAIAAVAALVLAAAATRHAVPLTLLTLFVALLPIGYLWLLDVRAGR